MHHVATPILKIDEARVEFAEVQALNGLSLEIFPGELLCLLGPNGAGKTTLIRSIAGRQRISSGVIRFDDQPVGASRAVNELGAVGGLGVVPQDIALYLDLTVKQNLRAFAKLHGLRGREVRERTEFALEWTQLKKRQHSLAGTLSGGMQRRLNIACGVLHEPSLVLLDEPTVGVDPQSRENIYEMLEDLLGAGTAILLTTHQLEEVEQRCDRIAIIDRGRILDQGTLEELLVRAFGDSTQIVISFREPPRELPSALSWDQEGYEASGELMSVDRELPELLFRLRRQHAEIESLQIREASLQQLFLEMTGQELRE